MVTQYSGGRFPLIGGTLGSGDPIFLTIRLTGKDFPSDLVANPNDPLDVAAAIGSDTEVIAEVISGYGSILGLALDDDYWECILDYNSAFHDPKKAQAVAIEIANILINDHGLPVSTIYGNTAINPYPWANPS